MQIGIIGGGVGGLSTAILLKQAGHDVEVYERNKSASEIGAGIVCWPNASFVLDKMGILERIQSVSGLVTKMNRFTHKGDALGTMEFGELYNLMGYPSLSITRKDLMLILTSRLNELNIQINYQHNVNQIDSDAAEKAKIYFDNGKHIQPDVIIAADGRMNSIARKYITTDNKPVYQGFINWIGVFESKNNLFPDISVSDFWGTGSRFGIVPVNKNKAYWAAGVAATKIEKLEPEHYKTELNLLFKDWPDPITKIINETPDSVINKIYVHDHDPTQSWHKGNILMIGDAAHAALPTSGQGACQAMEDAWQLDLCLRENNMNISDSFKYFTRLRTDKTTAIIQSGRQLAASIFNNDPEFCKQRNISSKNTNYSSAVHGMASIWSQGLPIHPTK